MSRGDQEHLYDNTARESFWARIKGANLSYSPEEYTTVPVRADSTTKATHESLIETSTRHLNLSRFVWFPFKVKQRLVPET